MPLKFLQKGMTYSEQRSLFPVPQALSPDCPESPGLSLSFLTLDLLSEITIPKSSATVPYLRKKDRPKHNFCKTAERFICCSGNKSCMEEMNEQHVSGFQISFLEMNESFCFPSSISFLANSP